VPQRSLTIDRAAGWVWRSLVVAIGIYVVVTFLSRLQVVILPVIVALLIATVLMPVVDRLHEGGVPRLAATWAVLVAGIGLFAGLAYLLAPTVAQEFRDLGPTVEQGWRDVQQWIASEPFGLEEEEYERYIDQAFEQLRGRSDQIASGVVSGAVLAFEVLAGIILLVVLLFFILKDAGVFTGFFMRQIRSEHHDTARALGQRAWSAAGGYVRGTAIVATVDAVIIGIGLVIIGVPLVLPLAILTFLGAFLPLVGAVLAGLVAALVALVDGGITDALLVTGLIVIVQQVEGDVLAPLVLGRAVKLHPVVILLVLTAGAIIGGLIGAFLAVPVTAVLVAVGTELRARGIIGPGEPVERGPDPVSAPEVEA
jgi:predicted PurR-regulated permease PerM